MQRDSTAPSIQLRTIAYNDLIIGETIGSGGYGTVSRAKWYGTEVAIKEFHLKTLTASLQEEFAHEAKIMAQCQFPHIVSLYGICDEPGRKGLVMEYMSKGSLRAVLDDKKEILDWEKRLSIATGIGKGLQYLHGQNILHRNLKSHNILLDANYHTRICDFGLSKIKLETSSNSTMHKAGTIRWRAPETFKRGSSPKPSMDVYSYGMILWELATKQLPFSDAHDEMTVMGWIKDGGKEIIPTDCPKEYGEIIQDTWAEAEKRPAVGEVVKKLGKIKLAVAAELKSEVKLNPDNIKATIEVDVKKADVDISLPQQEENKLSAEEQFNEGLKYYKGEGVEKDYKLAVKYFELAVKQGHADAQIYFGTCFALGQGVERNYKYAVWYLKSQRIISPPIVHPSLSNSAYTLNKIKKPMEKWELVEKQLKNGLCLDSEIRNWNWKVAIQDYQLAADQEHPAAQYYLAICYEKGLGIDIDNTIAIKYFELAVRQDYASEG